MYRGTTPTLTFYIEGNAPLTNLEQVWVTLQGNVEKTWEIDEVVIDIDARTISVSLTQQDTLAFEGDSVMCQIRFLYTNGSAVATEQRRIVLNEILKEGVIS